MCLSKVIYLYIGYHFQALIIESNGDSDKKKRVVDIYNASEIQASVALTEGGLLLFALLNGGDYDVGLPFFFLSILANIYFTSLDLRDVVLQLPTDLHGQALVIPYWMPSVH